MEGDLRILGCQLQRKWELWLWDAGEGCRHGGTAESLQSRSSYDKLFGNGWFSF